MNCDVEEGHWLVASVPAGETAKFSDLFALQAQLRGPIKAVAPDMWRVEMPICEAAEAIVYEIATSMAATHDAAGDTAPQAEPAWIPEELPGAAFTGQPWERVPAGLALRLNGVGANHLITASASAGVVFFRTALVRRRIPESTRDVLVHFLLALNARLRLARSLFGEDCIVLEVALPASALDHYLVEEAVGALAAGFRLARRECACLLDGQVARQYREFHLSKGEQS
jgi:hypothetical protein